MKRRSKLGTGLCMSICLGLLGVVASDTLADDCPPGVCPWHDRTPAICDCDADGRPLVVDLELEGDCHMSSRTRFEYSDDGELSRVENDLGRDGIVDDVTIWYRSNRAVVAEQDLDADGSVDGRTIEVLDATGNVIVESVEVDGELRTVTFNEYGADGLLRETSVWYAGGGIDYTISYTYDQAGEKALVVYRRGPPDGYVMTERTWQREGGVEIESAVDYEPDGSTIEANRTTRDGSGRIIAYEIDGNGDGIFEQRARFTYDAEGRAVEARIVHGERECVRPCEPYGDPAVIGPLSPGYCPLMCP